MNIQTLAFTNRHYRVSRTARTQSQTLGLHDHTLYL